MKIAGERKAIEAALSQYRSRLDTIPDGQFDEMPPGGGWSYAEVYSHILQATIGSSVAAEKCANPAAKPTNKRTNLLGKLMLLSGSLPPVKVKVPAAIDAAMPAAKISKEDARNLLVKCRGRIEKIVPLVHNALPNRRIAHPRFGMMNSGQWLRFMRVHLQHHLKQIQRIEKKFNK